eukprot:Sdes_comp22771_c0_seq1m21175
MGGENQEHGVNQSEEPSENENHPLMDIWKAFKENDLSNLNLGKGSSYDRYSQKVDAEKIQQEQQTVKENQEALLSSPPGNGLSFSEAKRLSNRHCAGFSKKILQCHREQPRSWNPLKMPCQQEYDDFYHCQKSHMKHLIPDLQNQAPSDFKHYFSKFLAIFE